MKNMSQIVFHEKSGQTAAVAGSERARFALLCTQVGVSPLRAAVPSNPLGSSRESGLLAGMIDAAGGALGATGPHWPIEVLAMDKGVLPVPVRFDGTEYQAYDLNLNTAMVVGSPPVAFAARLHAFVEAHVWVGGLDRVWLADVIEQGLDSGLYRVNVGWENVIGLLQQDDQTPVVTSTSVAEGWPRPPAKWLDARQGELEHRWAEWDRLPADTRWHIALEGIEDDWWLHLDPTDIHEPCIGNNCATYLDLLSSTEWKQATETGATV